MDRLQWALDNLFSVLLKYQPKNLIESPAGRLPMKKGFQNKLILLHELSPSMPDPAACSLGSEAAAPLEEEPVFVAHDAKPLIVTIN